MRGRLSRRSRGAPLRKHQARDPVLRFLVWALVLTVAFGWIFLKK